MSEVIDQVQRVPHLGLFVKGLVRGPGQRV